jgi:hypothetical protein
VYTSWLRFCVHIGIGKLRLLKPEINDRTLKHCQTILKGEIFKGDLSVLRQNISTLTVINNQLEFILKELKKKNQFDLSLNIIKD